MSKRLCRIFLLIILALATTVAHGAPSSDSVDLPLNTAIAMAIRNNLDLRVDALYSSITETALQQSRGIYDPLLSVSAAHDETLYTGEKYGSKSNTANVGVTQSLSSGGSLTAFTNTSETTPLSDPDYNWTDWYAAAGITFTQPLLKNFGKESTELSISLAANTHEASIEQYRDSVIGTVYDVIKAYNRLYTLRLVLHSRETALASAQKLLVTFKQDSQGEQQSVELANVKYSISRRLKDLVDAEKNLRDQEAKLRYLIGVENKLTLNPVDLPSVEEPQESSEQAIALAMENGFNLKQLRLDLQSSELQERVSKRNLRPNLALSTSIGFRGIEDTFGRSVQQIGDGKGRWWSAGLQLSMPLGNTVAESNYRRDKLLTQQTTNRIAATEWKLRDTIETDMRALISARVQRQVADKSLLLSEQRLEQYRKSVARNTSNVQDLLNAENDLFFAKITGAEARETFSNAVALLWRDAGVLLERKNIHVNIAQPAELTLGTRGSSEPAFTPRDIQALAIKTETEIEQPAVVVKPIPAKVEVQSSASGAVKPPEVKGQKAAASIAGAENALYTLRIGEYVSSELVETQQKIKKAGLLPLVSPGSKQSRQVIRLRAGDYSTQLAAKMELSKFNKLHADGFVLNRGKAGFRLYVGSYFSQQGAQQEQRRLSALGFATSLEEAEVMLPTSLLFAGRFPDHDTAMAGALKLSKLGVVATVLREK